MVTKKILITFVSLLLLFTACNSQSTSKDSDNFRIMATTSIVGDIVRQVGGDFFQVEVLLPLGTDPHSFTPTPQDIARLSKARLVFINGAGLEEFLTPMIQNAGVDLRVIDLSTILLPRSIDDGSEQSEHGSDPHTWMDPNNVMIWTQMIANVLGELDPEHEAVYQENASHLQSELQALDLWVREQVEKIPAENRLLVTDHMVFGYFADRYGFRQVGAIIPGFSTLAEPSAQEMAELEDAITKLGVQAIFVGFSTNQNLADRIARDTGVRVISLYTHSLSAEGGDAPHYQDFIHYNVTAIVDGLR